MYVYGVHIFSWDWDWDYRWREVGSYVRYPVHAHGKRSVQTTKDFTGAEKLEEEKIEGVFRSSGTSSELSRFVEPLNVVGELFERVKIYT